MGVPLAKLVRPKKISFTQLRGKALAIDAFNAIYQFLALIRRGPGIPLTDREGRVTSHLNGLLFRTVRLIELGIKPVYVFDGPPPDFKKRTLEERRAVKEKAEREWIEAIARGDFRTAWAKAVQTSRLTSDMASDAKRLLDLIGVPWVQAPSEGEAQAAHMAARGDVWAAASQDYDSLLFGSPRLVRNVTITGKKYYRKRLGYYRLEPELIVLEELLSSLGISREQLVDMAILMGTDYNEGVKGIGPVKALKLIRQYGSLDGALRALGVRPDPNIDLKAVRRFFLDPPVTEEYELVWRPPDEEGLIEFLCEERDFSKKRVLTAIDRLRSSFGSLEGAGSLEDYWSD